MQTKFGRLILVVLALAGVAAEAQEAANEATPGNGQAAEIDELQPALSSRELAAEGAAIEPGLSSAEIAAAGQATESAVAAAVPARDIRRRAAGSGVMDEINLGRTEITGNQELPKVLYIVPWQKSDPGDLTGKPINSLLDEVLAPIDRTEFIRQIDYYDDLYGKDQE